ncbi:MAG: DUF4300 family protein [Peptostreptococcaceae bacterium]
MKLKTYILGLLCTTLLFTGCSNQYAEESAEITKPEYRKEYKLNYSNLTNKNSKEVLINSLNNGDINKDYIYQFEKQLDFYNNIMKDMKGMQSEFATTKYSQAEYDDVYAIEKWEELGYPYQDFNCRITAFELYRDFIKSKDIFIGDDSNLAMDLDSIENNPLTRFRKEDVTTFKNLFSAIKTEDTKDEKVHLEIIKKELSQRGIAFEKNDKISMINAYLHDYDLNEMFIGHSALLIEGKDELLLLEKYSFLVPYQVSKFNTKKEVYAYLMDRLDIDTTGKGSKPIIMENDELMDIS